MGPLLMTGLNIFGATVGVGLVAARMRPLAVPAAAPPTPRNLAVTVIAFCSGIGVLGAVLGILAIEDGLASDPADATDCLATIGPSADGSDVLWQPAEYDLAALALSLARQSSIDAWARRLALSLVAYDEELAERIPPVAQL